MNTVCVDRFLLREAETSSLAQGADVGQTEEQEEGSEQGEMVEGGNANLRRTPARQTAASAEDELLVTHPVTLETAQNTRD